MQPDEGSKIPRLSDMWTTNIARRQGHAGPPAGPPVGPTSWPPAGPPAGAPAASMTNLWAPSAGPRPLGGGSPDWVSGPQLPPQVQPSESIHHLAEPRQPPRSMSRRAEPTQLSLSRNYRAGSRQMSGLGGGGGGPHAPSTTRPQASATNWWRFSPSSSGTHRESARRHYSGSGDAPANGVLTSSHNNAAAGWEHQSAEVSQTEDSRRSRRAGGPRPGLPLSRQGRRTHAARGTGHPAPESRPVDRRGPFLPSGSPRRRRGVDSWASPGRSTMKSRGGRIGDYSSSPGCSKCEVSPLARDVGAASSARMSQGPSRRHSGGRPPAEFFCVRMASTDVALWLTGLPRHLSEGDAAQIMVEWGVDRVGIASRYKKDIRRRLADTLIRAKTITAGAAGGAATTRTTPSDRGPRGKIVRDGSF